LAIARTESLPQAAPAPHTRAALVLRPAAGRDLDRVNALIGEAVAGWNLPVRVARLALPSLGYSAADLVHMRVVLAEAPAAAVAGVAAWEAPAAGGRSPHSASVSLHGLYVAPSRQRCGLGAHLLEHVIEQAAATGAAGVSVCAWRTAEGFFLARGFVPGADERGSPAYPRRLWRSLP
jgi:GNAT superfamily N-acetyltransferase